MTSATELKDAVERSMARKENGGEIDSDNNYHDPTDPSVDESIIAEAYLAAVARSKQPIEAKALKSCGFKATSHRDFRRPLHHPCGLMWDGGKHTTTRMWVLHRVNDDRKDDLWMWAEPQPQNMADVDALVARMSRVDSE